MQWDDWIELDNEFLKYHALKTSRIAERGEKCCKTAPEAWDAAVELLEELCEYLPERYPSLFEVLEDSREGVKNLETGEIFDMAHRLAIEKEDPMQICARLVQDDLAIMIERADGQYYLLAGAILLAGFWRLEDKFGMPLSEIHTSGDVPQYKEKLEKGMLNMFKRLQPEKPVQRNNYFIQVDDNLAWSESLGSEDEEGINWASASTIEGVGSVYFRSERQSLRRYAEHSILQRHLCIVLTAADSLDRAASFLQFALTSILSPRSAKSHMYLEGLRVPCVVGVMTLVGTREKHSMRMCCSTIWMRCIKSRLKRVWTWRRRMRLGPILTEPCNRSLHNDNITYCLSRTKGPLLSRTSHQDYTANSEHVLSLKRVIVLEGK